MGDSPSRLNSTLAKAVKTVSKLQRPAKEPQWRGPGTISRGLVMYQAFITANGHVVSLGSFVEFEHDGAEGVGVVTQAWQLPSGPKWFECRRLMGEADTADLPAQQQAA